MTAPRRSNRHGAPTCVNGHPRTPENQKRTADGFMRCAICLRDWHRHREQRRKLVSA